MEGKIKGAQSAARSWPSPFKFKNTWVIMYMNTYDHWQRRHADAEQFDHPGPTLPTVWRAGCRMLQCSVCSKSTSALACKTIKSGRPAMHAPPTLLAYSTACLLMLNIFSCHAGCDLSWRVLCSRLLWYRLRLCQNQLILLAGEDSILLIHHG